MCEHESPFSAKNHYSGGRKHPILFAILRFSSLRVAMVNTHRILERFPDLPFTPGELPFHQMSPRSLLIISNLKIAISKIDPEGVQGGGAGVQDATPGVHPSELFWGYHLLFLL